MGCFWFAFGLFGLFDLVLVLCLCDTSLGEAIGVTYAIYSYCFDRVWSVYVCVCGEGCIYIRLFPPST